MISMMKDYAVFGGRLRSALAFPELLEQEHDGPFDWSLDVAESPSPVADEVLLGEVPIEKNVSVRLCRHAHGFRLTYDDTGVFDVSGDGRRIVWAPAPNASVDSARLDVIGFVLGVALHAAGVYTLHGSAIATRGGVAAFIAPKGHGKSTLAMAMVAAGARLVTDDSLAIKLDSGGVLAAPGIHSIRLRSDSFERIPMHEAREVSFSNGKRLLRLENGRNVTCATPLEAVYLLTPVVSDATREAVRRTRLEPGRSALVLAGHAKLAHMLAGTSEAASMLGHAAAVARCVPVYALEVARDLDRLPEVVEGLLRWHPFVA